MICRLLWLSAAAWLLLWPALLNGYPLVFADTGTYLSQAINHHLGWDRPPFYSLFLLSLHLTITTWPAILGQALLACWVISILGRTLISRWCPWMIIPVTLATVGLTSLPWDISELSPDFLTPLMAVALGLLAIVPDRLKPSERLGLMALITFAVSAHLSNAPIGLLLVSAIAVMNRAMQNTSPRLRPLNWRCPMVTDPRANVELVLGQTSCPSFRRLLAPLLAMAVGVTGLIASNVAAGRGPTIAPYGRIFLLARVIADGPGQDAVRNYCPQSGWRLCSYSNKLPTDADEFLWSRGSPLYLAGGPDQIREEAGQILTVATETEPLRESLAFLGNSEKQFIEFRTGDGLHPWSAEVTQWIKLDFPSAELKRYLSARQTRGIALVPDWLQRLHIATVVTGIGLIAIFLLLRRLSSSVEKSFAAAALFTLVANAMICGGLSGPHDRYQSRVAWLPGLVAGLVLTARICR